jgi:hypothetical protein
MTDQPQPAATEAAMIQEIDDARRAFEYAVISHALGRTDAGEYGAAIHRLNTFMHHLTAAAPPSGQVVVSADAAHLARIALDAFITAGDVDYDWTPYIAARDEFVAALNGADHA